MGLGFISDAERIKLQKTRIDKNEVNSLKEEQVEEAFNILSHIKTEIERIRLGIFHSSYRDEAYGCPGDNLDRVCGFLSNSETVTEYVQFISLSSLREVMASIDVIYCFYEVFSSEIIKLKGWYNDETSYEVLNNSKSLMKSAMFALASAERELFSLPAPCFSIWMVDRLAILLHSAGVISSASASELCEFLNLDSPATFIIHQMSYFGYVLYALKPVTANFNNKWIKQVSYSAGLGDSTAKSAYNKHRKGTLENDIDQAKDEAISKELSRIINVYKKFNSLA